jgi:hypothetical protein
MVEKALFGQNRGLKGLVPHRKVKQVKKLTTKNANL